MCGRQVLNPTYSTSGLRPTVNPYHAPKNYHQNFVILGLKKKKVSHYRL